MGLSSDLISQFVKITNDSKKKIKETTLYGTVKFVTDKPFVQLDGSAILTPVTTTSSIRDGNRVTVLIKNHSAIITGNVTAPSASSEMLNTLANDLGLVGNDLAGISSDFDLLVRTVDEINNDLVETGQQVVGNRASIKTLQDTLNGLFYIKNETVQLASGAGLALGGLVTTNGTQLQVSIPLSKYVPSSITKCVINTMIGNVRQNNSYLIGSSAGSGDYLTNATVHCAVGIGTNSLLIDLTYPSAITSTSDDSVAFWISDLSVTFS